VIPRQRASVVCVHAGRLLCVQLRDPTTRVARLFVPGGAIEAGETPEQAAVRETLEETGHHVRLLPRSQLARYPYVWNGQSFDVSTHFIAAELSEPNTPPHAVDDAAYNECVVWLGLEAVPFAMSFEPTMLAAVVALLPLRSETDI
jgi:8-oxo-dGTP pyrophosphatase MutT (NUDIX family)